MKTDNSILQRLEESEHSNHHIIIKNETENIKHNSYMSPTIQTNHELIKVIVPFANRNNKIITVSTTTLINNMETTRDGMGMKHYTLVSSQELQRRENNHSQKKILVENTNCRVLTQQYVVQE